VHVSALYSSSSSACYYFYYIDCLLLIIIKFFKSFPPPTFSLRHFITCITCTYNTHNKFKKKEIELLFIYLLVHVSALYSSSSACYYYYLL